MGSGIYVIRAYGDLIGKNLEIMGLLDERIEGIKLDVITAVLEDSICGEMDNGDLFAIDFLGDKGALMVSADTSESLEVLCAVASDYMRGGPAIRYLSATEGKKIPTLLWVSEEEVDDVVGLLIEYEWVSDLGFFGERDIDYYTSAEGRAAYTARQKEKLKIEKVLGVYPSDLDVAKIEAMSDFELFFEIKSYANRSLGHISDYLLDSSVSESMYAYAFLVCHVCERNNIRVTKFAGGVPSVPDFPEFSRWYHFYNSHFDGFSAEDMAEFLDACANGEDISDLLPEGDWREYQFN